MWPDDRPLADEADRPQRSAAKRDGAEGGVTWAEMDAATHEHGLALPGGVVSSTGIAGLTLGGGLGWTQGRVGLTADNLLGAEVVTADGSVVVASEDDHADLFWALRGGGGNFGVVTRFTYRAHPLTTVLGGLIAYPADEAAQVLDTYRAVTAGARRGFESLTAHPRRWHRQGC
jgi:FAD/FMN-containing dehydrogenase